MGFKLSIILGVLLVTTISGSALYIKYLNGQVELRNKFARHDLNNLALMKPGLIERRVNAGSKKVFDELMSITSPYVKDENISPNN